MSDRRNKTERRTSKERRLSRERRRVNKEDYTVIEITGTELRVATLKQSPEDQPDCVRSFKLTWRVEAKSLLSDDGLKELSGALEELVERHDIPATNIQVVLGGEYCVTKAVRGTTEAVRQEMQQLEQRGRLYLMLGPGEKVTVNKLEPLDARHHYAVASVCNRQTIETIHQAATQVGMQIDSIEPALVSSSRVVGRLEDAPERPCLLLQLGSTSLELGVCYHGRLLLDHRPSGRTDPEGLVEHVRTHLNRLQRHVGRQLGEAPPSLNKVYLCGDESIVEQAIQAFAECEQFEVQRINPTKVQATWDFEDGAEQLVTVPALGALLRTYLPRNECRAPNFMEHILASTRIPLRPIILRSLVPLAATLLVALGVWIYNYSVQTEIDAIQTKLDSLVVVLAKDRDLRLKSESSTAKLVQLRALADQMEAFPLSSAIAQIGHCMPSDVWLNRMSIRDLHAVELTGSSYQEAGVFDFVNWLEQAPRFTNVALRSTQPGNSPAGPTINFNVELDLGDPEDSVKEVARNE